MPLLYESIAGVQEGPLVAMILDDTNRREMLLNIKGIVSGNRRPWTEVPLREYRETLRGDVDLLVVPPGDPAATTAVQIKRLGLEVQDDETIEHHVGRMRKLFKKGAIQTEELVKAGFAQVYLWMIIAVDSRRRNAGRFVYDGAGPKLRAALDDVPLASALNPRVGLMKFEFVQPIDRPPLTLGTSSGHIVELAKMAAQPCELTAWLAARMAQTENAC